MSGKYGNFGGNDNSQNNDLNLTVTPYTAFLGYLDSLRPSYGGQFGQSVGFRMTDMRLIDGVLTQRRDDPSKLKAFSWSELGFTEEMGYSAEDAPKFHSQSFKETYHFDTIAAVVADDPTNPDSVTSAIVVEDGEFVTAENVPYEIGDVIMWESGGGKPSATAKRVVRTLSTLGDAAVVDESNIHGWLAQSGIEMRPELQGQRILYSIIKRPGKKYDFNFPTFVTYPGGQNITKAGSGAGAPVQTTDGAASPAAVAPANGQTDGGFTAAVPVDDAPSAQAVQAGADESEVDQNAAPETATTQALPGPVESFVQGMVLFHDADEADVLTELYSVAEDDANSLTSAMIDEVGEENILQAVKAAREN